MVAKMRSCQRLRYAFRKGNESRDHLFSFLFGYGSHRFCLWRSSTKSTCDIEPTKHRFYIAGVLLYIEDSYTLSVIILLVVSFDDCSHSLALRFKSFPFSLEPRILELFIESLFIVLSHRLSLLLVYDSCHTRYECLFLETQFPEERCRLGTLYRR